MVRCWCVLVRLGRRRRELRRRGRRKKSRTRGLIRFRAAASRCCVVAKTVHLLLTIPPFHLSLHATAAMASSTTSSQKQKQKSITPKVCRVWDAEKQTLFIYYLSSTRFLTARKKNPNPRLQDQSVTYEKQGSVSCLSWSPTGNYLASGNWDGMVSIWLVEKHDGQNIKFNPVMQYTHGGSMPVPVLDVCWSPDGLTVFSGGCDGNVVSANGPGQPLVLIGAHDQPVSAVRYFKKHDCVVSGSWDGKVKFWQIGNPNPIPIVELKLTEKVYNLDVCGEVMVVGLSNRWIVVYDLKGDGPYEVSREQSPLPYQTREITVFPDATGYAVSDIGGRIGIQYLDEKKKDKSFKYTAHYVNKKEANGKKVKDCFSVNAIAFHKTAGIFASAGSDGK